LNDLTNRVALVTGGTRGIGRAIAEELARGGATVMIASRKAEAVERVTAELCAAGLQVHGVAANVSRLEDLDALVERTLESLGGVDVLVNNAAANPVYGPALETTPEAFDKIFAVNLRAPFELSRRVVPSMIARGGGSIINIVSIGGLSPEPGVGIYSVSKAALISLTKTLARELGRSKIRVNAIAPGFVKTDFSAVLWKNEETVARILEQQALPYLADPSDIGGIARFLASDAASYCTGAVFVVDGGYTI
jgi:dehydrogenase/reductase SDR family member 4